MKNAVMEQNNKNGGMGSLAVGAALVIAGIMFIRNKKPADPAGDPGSTDPNITPGTYRANLYNDLYGRGGSWTTAAAEFANRTNDTMVKDELYSIYMDIYNSMVGGTNGGNGDNGNGSTDPGPAEYKNLVVKNYTQGILKKYAAWSVNFSFEHKGRASNMIYAEARLIFPSHTFNSTTKSYMVYNDMDYKVYTVKRSGRIDYYEMLQDGEVADLQVTFTDSAGKQLLSPALIPNVITYQREATPGETNIKQQLGAAWEYISGCTVKVSDYVIWVRRSQAWLTFDNIAGMNQIGTFQAGDQCHFYCTSATQVQKSTGIQTLQSGWNEFIW